MRKVVSRRAGGSEGRPGNGGKLQKKIICGSLGKGKNRGKAREITKIGSSPTRSREKGF